MVANAACPTTTQALFARKRHHPIMSSQTTPVTGAKKAESRAVLEHSKVGGTESKTHAARKLDFVCATSGLPALPEKVTQGTNAGWLKEAKVPEGLIKQRGEGRAAEVVRKEMALFKLGADAAEPTVAFAKSMLVPPEETKEAQAAYVKEYLDVAVTDRAKILPLSGKGRTIEVVAADVKLVLAGAQFAASAPDSPLLALPAEVTQGANAGWLKEAKVPEGLIKQRGEGRAAEVVRKEMALFKLGADAAEPTVAFAKSMLVPPEETKEAQAAYVKEYLDVAATDRAKILPLSGKERTVQAVAADVALVIAGAKCAVARGLC